MDKETRRLRKRLLAKRKPETAPDWSKGLSSGSTLLNLACSGRSSVGFLGGHYYYFVGDSSSGKTWLSMTCFAEACMNPHFKNHRLIFDEPEQGALMDRVKYFGETAAAKMEPPSSKGASSSLEEFYFNLDSAFDDGRPFIYVVDSMDALLPKDDEEKFQEDKKAHQKGNTGKGTYGTAKAKVNSNNLRVVFNRLREDGRSILILISQTRDNIGFGSQFNPKTRSGGRALTFYATLEMWTSIRKHLKAGRKGRELETGIISTIRIKKNRLTGKDRTVLVPILHSTGIDDLGSCVDYLVEESFWKESKGIIEAPEFDYSGDREGLIQLVQDGNQEKELRLITAGCWNEIENAVRVNRKMRYT